MPRARDLLLICLLVVVEHMRENIFGVFEPLGHLGVVAIKGLVKWHCRAFSLLVNIGDVPVLRVEQNLRVVLEVHLHNFVAQPEHDCMFCSHPFLHVYRPRRVLQLVGEVYFVPLDQLCFLLRVVVLLEV